LFSSAKRIVVFEKDRILGMGGVLSMHIQLAIGTYAIPVYSTIGCSTSPSAAFRHPWSAPTPPPPATATAYRGCSITPRSRGSSVGCWYIKAINCRF
jgi:hypothetical protein